ncbi:MAG: hypothetical protein ACD_73C00348G0005 [uncultured bacterium]|nr:MAG: hypothetical protein ACD_73C00348G0005 [uncultured bacterium]
MIIMSSRKLFLFFWSISFLVSPYAFAEIKAQCLQNNHKWKSCHVDFNEAHLKWRLKNNPVWSELAGTGIKRIVQSLPSKPAQALTVGLELNSALEGIGERIEGVPADKSYPFYIPIEWQNTDKSVLALEYVTENGGKAILFLALSFKDEFVVKSKLELLSGLVIEKVYGR